MDKIIGIKKKLVWEAPFKYIGENDNVETVNVKFAYPSQNEIMDLEREKKQLEKQGKTFSDSDLAIKVFIKTIIEFPCVIGWKDMNRIEKTNALLELPSFYLNELGNIISKYKERLTEKDVNL